MALQSTATCGHFRPHLNESVEFCAGHLSGLPAVCNVRQSIVSIRVFFGGGDSGSLMLEI